MSGVLLLLTHQYPHDYGDAAFVRNEIDALAARFDEVRIVSFWGEGVPALTLPANCTYLGSIGRVTSLRAARGLASVRRIARAITAVAQGVRVGTFNPAADFKAMAVGMAIAHRLNMLGARRHKNEPLTVYSFWGVDIAYSLPWFSTEHDRLAVRVHRYDLDQESEGYRPLRPAVLGNANLVLTISAKAQHYARTQYRRFLDPSRVRLYRLGVIGPEVRRPDPGTSARASAHIVSASSVIPLKRVDRILDVMVELVRRGRPVEWTHFGDGPGWADLQKKAEELSLVLPGLRVILPGRVPVATIVGHYAAKQTDAFVNLSTIEGVPVSIMEAAAYDVPAVATDVGATSEVVGEDRGSGVLIAVDASIGDTADAVALLLDSPEHFSARNAWSERFDAMTNASLTAEAIAELSSL